MMNNFILVFSVDFDLKVYVIGGIQNVQQQETGTDFGLKFGDLWVDQNREPCMMLTNLLKAHLGRFGAKLVLVMLDLTFLKPMFF